MASNSTALGGQDFNSGGASPEVVASGSAFGRIAAPPPSANTALQLAQSLANLGPNFSELGAQVAAQQQKDALIEARNAAIKTGGKPLAEAVKSGQISPTQNPFWVDDYNKESAFIGAQSALAAFRADTVNWPERNNPAAFQARYSKGLSVIMDSLGSQYGSSPEVLEGVNAAVAPAMQQDFAANIAEVQSNMVAQRNANVSALGADAIQGVLVAHGGKPSPQDVLNSLQPLEAHYLGTGGTQQDFDKLAVQSVISAAERTGNTGLLDALKAKRPDGTSLYDVPGVAEQVETIKFRITSNARDAIRLGMQEAQIRNFMQGQQAMGELFQQFGPQIFRGLTADQVTAASNMLAQNGHPMSAIADAFGAAAKIANSTREIAADRYTANTQSSTVGSHIGAMRMEALTMGWSQGLQSELGQAVLNGQIDPGTRADIEDIANKTTKAQATPHGLMASFDSAALQKKAAANIKVWSNARDQITQAISQSFQAYQKATGSTVPPSATMAAQDAALTEASNWLRLHPNDFAGAVTAAKGAAHQWAILYSQQNPASAIGAPK